MSGSSSTIRTRAIGRSSTIRGLGASGWRTAPHAAPGRAILWRSSWFALAIVGEPRETDDSEEYPR
jgi:hypothetical protein